jgi:hypothetical protein
MPSESSSGEPRRQGSMTTAGNTHARRARVEGAWAYRDPAKVSRHLPRRLEQPPNIIQEISWKAQVKLCTRDRRLVSRGKHANVVTVAMARELAGFMGAWPERCRSHPQTTRERGFHPHRRRFPTDLGRDAAPVWCHPRPRDEASRGDSSLDGGRHPTEASQVVANPRIAAGSTVGSYWLRLFRMHEGQQTS